MGPVHLVPFGPVDPAILNELGSDLRVKLGVEVITESMVPVPEESFNPQRDQYVSGFFLIDLRRFANSRESKFLGVTEVDLYSPGLNFVFGQADVRGKAAIISLARLRPEVNLDGGARRYRERALKEAVHEIGHTYGLEHCRDPYCVMHFSNDLPDTDIKSADFCQRHSAAFGHI